MMRKDAVDYYYYYFAVTAVYVVIVLYVRASPSPFAVLPSQRSTPREVSPAHS